MSFVERDGDTACARREHVTIGHASADEDLTALDRCDDGASDGRLAQRTVGDGDRGQRPRLDVVRSDGIARFQSMGGHDDRRARTPRTTGGLRTGQQRVHDHPRDDGQPDDCHLQRAPAGPPPQPERAHRFLLDEDGREAAVTLIGA